MRLALLFPLLLAGCATQPVSTTDADPVPASRIINTQYTQKSPDRGVVLVKRDSGWSGSACAAEVYVNSVPVAKIRSAEKIYLYLEPGPHNIGAYSGCLGGISEERVIVNKGQTVTLRISYDNNGGFDINHTSF